MFQQQKDWETRENAFAAFTMGPLTDFWRQRDEAEFTGVDDIPVRFVRFRAQHHDRVVVICPGRIESYVKYAELAYDLFHLGFDVLIIDHRGQGRSGRLLADPHLGHVNRFNDYVDDLAAFWQQEVQPGPWRKRYILAHSMGGAISTLFLQRHPGVCDAIALTAPMFGIVIRMPSFMARQIDLFETKIEQLADEIENIYSDLEQLSRVIMEGHQGDEYDEALSTLAELEDIGWKVRLCLMDTQRALNFLVRKARLPGGQLEQAREILRDIESLLPHNESLFQKVNFLMQAAMGFINIEQNRIIKIFSVVSVVFLPPTLVASSYGMNFEFMPELKWSFGYPGAIIFMILAGLAPYLYFKRKNWL